MLSCCQSVTPSYLLVAVSHLVFSFSILEELDVSIGLAHHPKNKALRDKAVEKICLGMI